jgi:hypothetical protein
MLKDCSRHFLIMLSGKKKKKKKKKRRRRKEREMFYEKTLEFHYSPFNPYTCVFFISL